MTKLKDAGEGLSALMDALADGAATASDHQVLDDAGDAGIDVRAEAGRVRDVLLAGVLRAKKERLRRAQQAHARSVADLGARIATLPDAPVARRALLTRTLGRRPDIREAIVTLQHRDFESFSDADIESALKQLEALGLLDGDPESNQ